MRLGYTDEQKAKAIYSLREDLRTKHKDIRFNSRIAKDCWEVIARIEDEHMDEEPTPPRPAAVSKGKRKQPADDGGEGSPRKISMMSRGRGRPRTG